MAQVSIPLDGGSLSEPVKVERGALVRLLASSAMAAAGVVHLVMVPSHFDEWVTEGLGFAVVGWLQLALAVALVVRSRRWVVGAAVLTNAVAIGLWTWSRTAGFPFGPHAHHAASVQLIDGATAALQATAALAALGVLARGAAVGNGIGPFRIGTALTPLTAVAVTTLLLASPSARNHVHDSHDGHAETGTAATHVHTDTPSVDPVAAGDSGAATATATTVHSHVETTVAAGNGAAPASSVAPAAAAAAAEEAGGGSAHNHGGSAAAAVPGTASADDLGWSLVNQNGHAEHRDPEPLTPSDAAIVAQQLTGTIELMGAYPTYQSAMDAGLKPAGGFSPGLGIHVGMGGGAPGIDGAIEGAGMAFPMLIYGGIRPDSPLVGFMYNAYGVAEIPEGFAGKSDVWHKHDNVCVKFTEKGIKALSADGVATKEWCDGQGGMFVENTGYMVHVWNVPGWEDPLGVFHEVNPAIKCPDGTYYTEPDKAKRKNELSACLNPE